MTDDRPPTYEELARENDDLRQENARLRSSVGSLQSTIVRQDAEIARAARPRPKPRALDPNAKDAFSRPFRG